MTRLRNSLTGVWERFQAVGNASVGVLFLCITYNCTRLNYCYCNYSN